MMKKDGPQTRSTHPISGGNIGHFVFDGLCPFCNVINKIVVSQYGELVDILCRCSHYCRIETGNLLYDDKPLNDTTFEWKMDDSKTIMKLIKEIAIDREHHVIPEKQSHQVSFSPEPTYFKFQRTSSGGSVSIFSFVQTILEERTTSVV